MPTFVGIPCAWRCEAGSGQGKQSPSVFGSQSGSSVPPHEPTDLSRGLPTNLGQDSRLCSAFLPMTSTQPPQPTHVPTFTWSSVSAQASEFTDLFLSLLTGGPGPSKAFTCLLGIQAHSPSLSGVSFCQGCVPSAHPPKMDPTLFLGTPWAGDLCGEVTAPGFWMF